MKLIVETTGNFGLMNSDTQWIESIGLTVVAFSTFVEERIANGQLKVFATGLPDKANQAELLKHVEESKGNTRMAIASFCAVYGVSPSGDALDPSEMEAPVVADTENDGAPTLPLSDAGDGVVVEPNDKTEEELAAEAAAAATVEDETHEGQGLNDEGKA